MYLHQLNWLEQQTVHGEVSLVSEIQVVLNLHVSLFSLICEQSQLAIISCLLLVQGQVPESICQIPL